MYIFNQAKRWIFLFLIGVVSVNINAQNLTESIQSSETGRELVLNKCSQCHTDSIWRDQRQDERAWEATMYRMMGRGAIWTRDEIKSMSAFLGVDFGNQSTKLKVK